MKLSSVAYAAAKAVLMQQLENYRPAPWALGLLDEAAAWCMWATGPGRPAVAAAMGDPRSPLSLALARCASVVHVALSDIHRALLEPSRPGGQGLRPATLGTLLRRLQASGFKPSVSRAAALEVAAELRAAFQGLRA